MQQIIDKLPYSTPFLFVDGLTSIDDGNVEGYFTFRENLDFYRGHFKDNPVTPGVILTETMAQIGLVCLGIHLLGTVDDGRTIALTSTEIEFLKPVFPGEKVNVIGRKVYFRFGKLKCNVTMYNAHGEEVCSGTIAGVVKP